MQLMWVSGPTASVRTISITAQKVLVAVCASAFVLVTFGVLLHFIGFRIAIEMSPSLARSMGGVTTEAEQQKVEAVYRERLDNLRQTMSATVQEIRQLETLKNRFMEVATPTNLRDKYSKKDDARGGPWLPPRFQHSPTRDLGQDFAAAMDEFSQTEAAVKNLTQNWSNQLSWLHALPTGIPMGKDFRVTSGFGIRNDPFTGQLAMHEGLDFVAEVGSPILVTAAGTVTRSGWDASYGNVVEVSHVEGFTTRYAHLSKRMVEVGQKVQRGETIAQLGSTGRSTGPHLHYEVIRNERVLNPTQMLMQSTASAQ
ncbi:M23 family metallopeptidase [Limnohabitans sp.]|uniref:M23 family metallopeptidase n=1 Tax=Limnohabitans sp. TaxID=1907725 RepID=UPI00286ECD44|nr:M23 family metallopeptidase [Limnohabitans sp.]